ncbi:MAG: DsbA family protein [Propionibacteriaceae bacterium]
MAPRGYSAASRQEALNRATQAAQLRRKVLWGLVVFIVIVVLVTAVPIVINTVRSKAEPTIPPDQARIMVTVESAQPLTFAQGNPGKTVSIVEDPTCTHCQELEHKHGEVLAQATRDAKITLQLFPVQFVDLTTAARLNNALACAAVQGVGLRYHAGIYANPQLEWNQHQVLALFSGMGDGLDHADFATCVETERYRDWQTSLNAAVAAQGIHETPRLTLNGEQLDWSSISAQSLAGRLS